MGQIRFQVAPPQRISEESVRLACMSGFDRAPWPGRTWIEGDEFVLERESADSGCLTIPWHVEGHGLMGLSTATLLDRREPYRLPLELARGSIHQLRNQLFEWQSIGLVVPRPVVDKLREATRQFSWAAVTKDEPASPATAQEALRIALDASQALAGAYAEQSIAVRRRGGGRLPALLGSELGPPPPEGPVAEQFLAAFNAALLPLPWRDIESSEGRFAWAAYDQQIEWCRAHGLKVCAGPLVQLDACGLPDWAFLWEDDIESLLAAAGDFVTASMERYRGRVDLWLCAGRANTSELLSISEEEYLRLTASIIDLVRRLDPHTPRAISIDQPWGEYMGQRPVDYSPLHFADALIRARLDLNAVILEINLGCFPGASLPRSEVEFSRQLDVWGMLGLPVLVSLSIPSHDGEDPLARRKVKVPLGSWNLEQQQAWASRYVPLALAKPCVQGVFWNQFCDRRPHDFPYAGLLADSPRPKPALRTLMAIRAACLAK